ncbi:SGNH/GDSL hydrolase family protein [Terrimonas alba]|uniref:SGNH/GDSL hydrolase family protein n=1 Tax=Terrimonas alba TaxID=3349636 RepID=UPI0035F379D5
MRLIFLILIFVAGNSTCQKKNNETMPSVPVIPTSPPMEKKYSYLAFGDSYTIGESVPAADNFPNQTVSFLNRGQTNFQPARIIARTGWTTDELEAGIVSANAADPLLSSYDFVSLLIGVNNQYRGRSVEDYNPQFEALLKKAIQFAGGKAGHVIVLSIPDWGVTPFAQGRDRQQITREIDAYNAANKSIVQRYQVHYIDITAGTREAATDTTLLAGDGLHPSAKEYAKWAKAVAEIIKSEL